MIANPNQFSAMTKNAAAKNRNKRSQLTRQERSRSSTHESGHGPPHEQISPRKHYQVDKQQHVVHCKSNKARVKAPRDASRQHE